jgi:hypothetical protein
MAFFYSFFELFVQKVIKENGCCAKSKISKFCTHRHAKNNFE